MDNSDAHDLHLQPTFSATAGGSETESASVEVEVVSGSGPLLQTLEFMLLVRPSIIAIIFLKQEFSWLNLKENSTISYDKTVLNG